MIYLIDITGLLLYMIFRIVILPVLAVVGCFFILLFSIKIIRNFIRLVRAINLKPVLPSFRFAKLRLLSVSKN